MPHDSSSTVGTWLSKIYAIVTLVLVLGGCLTVLSWTELNLGSAAKPTLDSPIGAIGLLRRHFGHSSTAAADAYHAQQGPRSSNSSSTEGEGHVLEMRMTANSSGWHAVGVLPPSAAAAAADMLDMDSLLAAVEMANSVGLAVTQNSSSSSSSALPPRAAAATGTGKAAAKTALNAAVGKAPTPPSSSAKPAAAAAAAQGATTTTASSSSSIVSSISSKFFGKETCSCLRANPTVLEKHCSVKDRGWPKKNAELVTDCFNLLVNETSDYLQLHEHNPSKGVDCKKQLLMHTFWSGDMNWKLKAVIQSFLFTHYSNNTSCRPKPVLNIWMQTVEPTRAVLEKWAEEWQAPYFVCSDQLRFHQWKNDGWLDWLPQSMLAAAGNATSNTTALHAAVRKSAAAGSRVAYSDAVRFLVLYNFGGIYTDGDVLLLRNLEPFSHYDFLYEWSFVKDGMNSAVFGARQHSPFAGAVIQSALKAAAKFNTSTGNVTFDARLFNGLFHPLRVLQRAPPKISATVETLPSIPFDPVWLTYDTPDAKTHNLTQVHKVRTWKDFFDKPAPHIVPPRVPTDVFRGAFAHHWHNNWKAPFEEKSLFGQLVGSFEDFLHGKLSNRYGLKYSTCSVQQQAVVPTRRLS